MSVHPQSGFVLRVAAVVGMLALTPMAFTAGGDLQQNDACAARTAGEKCCKEWDSVCTLNGGTVMDYYLTGMPGACGE